MDSHTQQHEISSVEHIEQSSFKKRNTKFPFLVLIGVLILVCIIWVGWIYHIHKPRDNKNIAKSVTNTCLCTLLFSKVRNLQDGSPITSTITDTNGTILTRYNSRPTDSTYSTFQTNSNGYISYTKGLLSDNFIFNGNGNPYTINKWALITSEGSIINIPSGIGNNFKNLRYLFVGDNNTLFALNKHEDGPMTQASYVQYNLKSGQQKTIFAISPASDSYYPLFQPEDISPKGDTISILVDDVKLNSQTITGTGVALYNTLSHQLRITSLPSTLATIARVKTTGNDYIPSIGISSDGTLIVYQSPNVKKINGILTQVFTTHVYNIALHKDVIVPTSITVPGGYNSYFFSPDNSYVVFYFANVMDIARTNDGKIVKSFNLGNEDPYNAPNSFNIEPIGWISNDTLTYISQTTDDPGNFDYSTATGHSVNVVTQQIINYPQDYGDLEAVIYK